MPVSIHRYPRPCVSGLPDGESTRAGCRSPSLTAVSGLQTVVRTNQSLSKNPCQSSVHTGYPAQMAHNSPGQAEVFMSLTGILGMGIVGPAGPMISSFGMCLAFLCLPGLLFSFSGVFLTPRRRAAYGIVFGATGSMFLLTFYSHNFYFPVFAERKHETTWGGSTGRTGQAAHSPYDRDKFGNILRNKIWEVTQ